MLVLGAQLLRLDLVASLLGHPLASLLRTSGERDAGDGHWTLARTLRHCHWSRFGWLRRLGLNTHNTAEV